jgi:hypothetical protein
MLGMVKGSEALEVARCRRSRYDGLYDDVWGGNSLFCLSVLCVCFDALLMYPLTLAHSAALECAHSFAVTRRAVRVEALP